KMVRPKHHWGMTLSPSGRQAIFYDGKDWNTMSLPDGKVTNLTRNIPARFYNEDFDSPSTPPAYGVMGWSSDEYYVLLYDKYDIWEVGAKGGSYRKLTQPSGKDAKLARLQYRYVKLDPKEKTIDLSQLMMLQRE